MSRLHYLAALLYLGPIDSAGPRLAETAGELRAAVQRYAEALDTTAIP